MAGDFQSEFWHGVPERASWSVLQSRSMFDEMQAWEQRGLVDEIERHEKAVDGERHVRKNCTIRWHATHWENCPSQCYGNQVRSGVAVRKSDASEAAGSSEMPVPTVIGTGFAGVKRSQDEAEVCDEVLRRWCGSCWSLWKVLRTARCIAQWCLGWSWWEVRRCMTKTCARWNQPRWTWGKLFCMRRKLLRAMERSLRRKWVSRIWTRRHWRRNNFASFTGIWVNFGQNRVGAGWLKRLSIPAKIAWPIMVNILSVWCHIESWSWCLMLWASQRCRDTWRLPSTWRCWLRERFLQIWSLSRAGRRRRKKKIWDLNGNKYQQTVWFWWKVWTLAMWNKLQLVGDCWPERVGCDLLCKLWILQTFGLPCKQPFGWHWSTCAHWMWKDNIAIVMMEPWWAQTMTFGSGSGWWNDICVELNCVLAGRSVCLCFYRLFAFLDLTAFRRGGLMHWGRGRVIDTQATWDITFAQWCVVKIEFADWPLRHVVDGRFVLDRQVATSKIDM